MMFSLANDIRQVLWFAVLPALITVLLIVFGIEDPKNKSLGNRFHSPIRRDALRQCFFRRTQRLFSPSKGTNPPRLWNGGLARNGVDEARVIQGWAPGGDAPLLIEASTSQRGVSLLVPRQELPQDD
jgi:hypothetical protein